jgi:hypothetical protein
LFLAFVTNLPGVYVAFFTFARSLLLLVISIFSVYLEHESDVRTCIIISAFYFYFLENIFYFLENTF